ncbi:MAG: hypothetical protein EAZ53_15235 [Bacteroidetes bacterium]|nr:MAG: hypothetical protein EAZ53_15235 [Bacteroidota bacterium]
MIITSEKQIAITNVDFIAKNLMIIHLNNDRILFVPLDNFIEILELNDSQRKDFEVIDNQNLSFLNISEIYSLQDLAGF